MSRLNKKLGAADKARLSDYLDDVREIERRIQQIEAVNSTGEPRELPGAPIGVRATAPMARPSARPDTTRSSRAMAVGITALPA